ncbi:MAG: PAS domain-containing protein, partial [Chloroflexota bacterium]
MKNITDQARLKKMEASQADKLRQQAEELYRQQNPEDTLPKTQKNQQQLVFELQIHQIELEMQNEDLKQAQGDLEKSHARYSDLFNFAPVGYLTVSKPGLILDANYKAATMLGEVRSRLVNQPLANFIFPADQDIVYLHRQTLFARGKAQASELRMVKNDGSVIWVYMEADLVQDVERSVLAYQIILNDITLRKQAEEALRQSEERYRLLADDAPLATLVSDLQTGEVLYTNRRAAELFEIPIDQLLKAKTPELYANPQERERILTLLNAHGQVKDFEVCLRKGDGREFW